MILTCRETITDYIGKVFTKGDKYRFTRVNTKYTRTKKSSWLYKLR